MEKFSNNATTVLSLPLDRTDTELTVQAGTGTLFPDLGDSDDYFYATIISAAGEMEIVKCTARNVDVFTVERAQQGTHSVSFPAGSIVQHRLTAEFLSRISPSVDDIGLIAKKLAVPRTISLAGKATSNPVSFDGTKNIVLTVTSLDVDTSGTTPSTPSTPTTVQNATTWAYSAKTISSAAPSGGSNNQIWFQYL